MGHLESITSPQDLRNPDLPDGRENNARLELYTLAMSQVAAARGVRFVDLFAPSKALFAAAKTPLTSNGVPIGTGPASIVRL